MSQTDLAWAEAHDLILIEGCDAAGKTTLAQAIAARRHAELQHSALTPAGADLLTRYRAVLAQPGPLILDRCFLSEAVYGPLYRGHCRLTTAEVTQLIRQVTERNGVFGHITADPQVLHRRLRLRGEATTPNVAELTRIVRAYDSVFADLGTVALCIRIDTTSIG